MLARRFTIICLIVTLFGMGLASVVAETGDGRRALPQQIGSAPLLHRQ